MDLKCFPTQQQAGKGHVPGMNFIHTNSPGMFCEPQLCMNLSLPLNWPQVRCFLNFLQYVHCSALHKLDAQHNLVLIVAAGDSFPLNLSYLSDDYMVV